MGRILLLTLVVSTCCFAQDDVLARGRRLQSQVLGVDAHEDTAQRVLMEHADLGKRLPDGQVDLPRLREGGIRVPFWALWVPTYYKGSEAVRRTLDLRDAMQGVFDRYPDQVELATSAAEVERILKSGKLAAVLTVEGGHQIANDLAVLRMYHRLGIRSMTLTHFRNNDWADSSTDAPVHKGLTDFGKEVVREMNRLGWLVDISHVSDKTFYDVLSVTSKPVIASHSSCRALADIPRNMTDDMLRALAKNGGVVGINFASGFISQKDADAIKREIAKLKSFEPDLGGKELDDFSVRERMKSAERNPVTGSATVKDVADQLDHAVKVAGIDHVGIGTDFDGIPSTPAGLEDISKMPALTAELLRRGYSETDVRKIMGENFLRVVREVMPQ